MNYPSESDRIIQDVEEKDFIDFGKDLA